MNVWNFQYCIETLDEILLWKNSLMETNVKNYPMRVRLELHGLDTTDSKKHQQNQYSNWVFVFMKTLITFFYHLDLFCRQYFSLVKFKYVIWKSIFVTWKSPVTVAVQLLGCGLNIVLIFEKQTKLPYIVFPKRDKMLLWLHKLKETLSIWGIAINVRCCY